MVCRDESGTITLVFRTLERKGEVKRGRYVLVTGTVACHNGRLQLQCGPRPTDLQVSYTYQGCL
jgi:hypothetical protein